MERSDLDLINHPPGDDLHDRRHPTRVLLHQQPPRPLRGHGRLQGPPQAEAAEAVQTSR